MSLGVWAILRVKKPKMETEKLIYIYSRSHPNQFSFKNQSINQSVNQSESGNEKLVMKCLKIYAVESDLWCLIIQSEYVDKIQSTEI